MKPDQRQFHIINEDRSDIVTTMYQNQEDETAAAPNPQAARHPASRTRRIRVGAVEYAVPTIEYVQQLESILIQQARALEQQQRVIERLAATVARTLQSQQGRTREMNELRRELSGKVSQRDAF